MKGTQEASLKLLLAELETTLVGSIPRSVERMHIGDPVYCLFLWYYDTSVFEPYTPLLGIGLDSLRQACLAKYLDDPNDRIWRPQQTIEAPFPGFPFPRADCDGPDIAKKCNECYRLMDAIFGSDEPLEDEGPMLLPFREMLWRVAQKLNRRDWSGILKTTDDFVVLAADYIGYWLAEDMEHSVPVEKLTLLKSRGRA